MQRNGVEMSSAKWALGLATAVALLGLAGCGKSSGGAGVTPPPPITIAFQSAPPTSVLVGSAPVPITAVVTNDAASRGVDWLLTCTGGGDCGSLMPLHTDSGSATIYTPPANVSGSSITVNIVAFASSDHASNVPASLSVASLNGNFSGTYVFDVSAASGGFPYHFAGVLVADGSGLITGGELTDFAPMPDPITSGTYQVGGDGRGTILLTLSSGSTVNFSFVLLSSSHALLNETDGFFGGTGTGTIDLQTSVAAPSGAYAFVLSGNAVDPTFTLPNQPEALGGILNIDAPGTISGSGSVADENLNGATTLNAPLTGVVSQPDSLGAIALTLSSGLSAGPIQLTGYIVDSKNIKLAGFPDPNTGAGYYVGGSALGQGSAAGTFHGNSVFSGPNVYGILGQRQSMTAAGEGPFWASAAWAGSFSADGAGHLTGGLADQNVGGVVVIDTLAGTYSVDASGTGRVTATTNFGSAGPGPQFVFYLTGNGGPTLVLDTDATGTGGGIVYPQASGAPSFAGAYGLKFDAGDGTDASGQMNADGVAGTLTGLSSTDAFGGSAPLMGTFALSASTRFDGTLTLTSLGGVVTNTGAFYIADPTQGFFIENDGVQVSLGYFAAQTALTQNSHGARAQRRRPLSRPRVAKAPTRASRRH